MKKRIVYIGNFDFEISSAATQRALSNLQLLSDGDFELEICGFGNPKNYSNIYDVSFHSIDKPDNVRMWFDYLTKVDRFSEFIEEGYLTYFVLYNLPSLLMINIQKKFGKKAKIVADITEWYSTEGLALPKKIIKSIDINIRMKVLNRRLDGLIVISTLLEEFYSDLDNIILIPPLASKSIFEVGNNNKMMSDSRIKFVYSGYPGTDKDRLDLIIEAFHMIVSSDLNIRNLIKLEVFGITKETYRGLFNNHDYFLSNLENIVEFKGSVTHEESIESLRTSDYSFLIRDASLKNNAGFPTKFTECYSLGVPVIYSKFSDISTFVDQNDILVETLSADNVKQAIMTAISKGRKINRQTREELSIKNEIFSRDFKEFVHKIESGG